MNAQLFQAARQGQAKLIKRRVEEGANLDAIDSCGYTALHLAVLSQSTDAVWTLLDQGADRCIFAEGIRAALHLAIIKQYHQCAALLLEPKCRAAVNGLGSVLHIAAYVGNLRVIENLKPVSLESRTKADIDLVKYAEMSGFAADHHNRRNWIRKCTPVMLAAFRGSTAVLQYLLGLPLRTQFSNGSMDGASQSLSRTYSASSARSFVEIRSGALDDEDDLQQTAFMLAAEQGHLDCLEELRYPNVNKRTVKGDTALSLALRGTTNRHSRTACYLLSLDADCKVCLEGQENVLHLAARNGHGDFMAEAIHRLVTSEQEKAARAKKSGTKTNQRRSGRNALNTLNVDAMTPLMLAASAGSEICCRHLLHAGALVDFRDPSADECTALVYAATHGHHRVVKLLLENEANLIPKASAGETPLHKAAAGGHHRVLEVFFECAGTRLPELLAAVDRTGNTALHTAATHNHRSCVEVFLKAGADMYKINPQSLSPRDIAMKRRYKDIEELFSDHEQELIRQRHLQQQNDHADDLKAKSRSMQPIWKALERMHLIGTLGSRYGVDL